MTRVWSRGTTEDEEEEQQQRREEEDAVVVAIARAAAEPTAEKEEEVEEKGPEGMADAVTGAAGALADLPSATLAALENSFPSVRVFVSWLCVMPCVCMRVDRSIHHHGPQQQDD